MSERSLYICDDVRLPLSLHLRSLKRYERNYITVIQYLLQLACGLLWPGSREVVLDGMRIKHLK
jgi:hypothetical protein